MKERMSKLGVVKHIKRLVRNRKSELSSVFGTNKKGEEKKAKRANIDFKTQLMTVTGVIMFTE